MENGENNDIGNRVYLTWLTRPAQYRKLSALTNKQPGGSDCQCRQYIAFSNVSQAELTQAFPYPELILREYKTTQLGDLSLAKSSGTV